MTDIVLVHGAFHGGWCWRAVAERLAAAGHRVFAPTLTGVGERHHLAGPAVDLTTHILDLANLIEWEELRDAVLVCHSYGGMPATGAADRQAGRLAALVYLDAFTPSDGDSALAVRTAEPGFMPLAESEDGACYLPPPAAAFGLEGDLAAWAERRLTPQRKATITQPIRLTGAWRGLRTKLYLRATGYGAPYFDKYFETAAADPDWIAIRREMAHNVMMTEPDWLVGQLRRHVL